MVHWVNRTGWQRRSAGRWRTVDLGGQIVPPQRDAEQKPHPRHDPVAIAGAQPALDQVQLEAADVVSCRRRASALGTWRSACSCGCGFSAHGAPTCGQPYPAISSIIRWRSGLTVVSVLMGSFS